MNGGNKMNYNCFNRCPNAAASMVGGDKYPSICGTVGFYQTAMGVIVSAEISGLPVPCGECSENIFAFHIHSGNNCSDGGEPFSGAMGHYNPDNCGHPYHAGDLPPLFGNKNGYAYLSFLTDRFTIDEIIGKTVIVHSGPDDFTTQPSGNSGERIACGKVCRLG